MITATNIRKAEIKLENSRSKIQFYIYTNVTEYGIPFIWIVEDWAAATTKHSPRSLCKFIMKISPEFVAMTEEQWQRLNQITNN